MNQFIKTRSKMDKLVYQYTLKGTLFGCLFPFLALVIKTFQIGLLSAFKLLGTEPLMWITFTIPIIVGVFSHFLARYYVKLNPSTDQNYPSTSEDSESPISLKMIIENLESGFLICDKNMKVLPNYSLSCHKIFQQKDIAGDYIPLLMQLPKKELGLFEMMYVQATSNRLDPDVFLNQIPKHFKIDDKTYKIEPTACSIDGKKDHVIFNIIDTSNQESLRMENNRNSNLVHLFRHRDGFIRFIQEAKSLLNESKELFTSSNPEKVRAHIHTLKGSAGCFGLDDLIQLIHTKEDLEYLSLQDVIDIENELCRFLLKNEDSLKIPFSLKGCLGTFVAYSQFDHFKQDVLNMQDIKELQNCTLEFIKTSYYQSAEDLFIYQNNLIERLSTKFKKPVKLQLYGANLRVDPERVGKVIQQLPHLIRNSLDHGIEHFYERGEKPEKGVLRVHFSQKEGQWIITYTDDGRGIDPEEILNIALDRGVITQEESSQLDQNEKLNLIFHPGFSTKVSDEKTEVSGQGVGMTSIKNCVEELGGSINVDSWPGKGTSFQISIPIDAT